jgi:hypothetical protein
MCAICVLIVVPFRTNCFEVQLMGRGLLGASALERRLGTLPTSENLLHSHVDHYLWRGSRRVLGAYVGILCSFRKSPSLA